MTRTDLAYDILYSMGMSHDDATRNLEAVLFNVNMVMNVLRRQRIEKEIAVLGDRGTAAAATTYVLPINEDSYLGGRLYFNLPGPVLDLRRNAGISYIRYHHTSGCADNLVGKDFTLISEREVHTVQNITFQRPSPANPYYWPARVNNGTTTAPSRIYMMGPSPLLKSLEVGLYLSLTLGPNDDPNEEVDFPDDLVYHVKRAVLMMERFALLVPQERLKNQGRDFDLGQQPLQPPTLLSVNDPMNLTTN
jgi:hypothetical protein